jgi:hypothetical protein
MRILGFMLLCVILLALGAAVGASAVTWIMNSGVHRTPNDNLFLPLTIQVIAVLFFFAFSIFVFVKIFRLAFRWIRWSADQSTASRTISLICFAIAAYFFPNPINFVFRQGWAFASEVLSSFPSIVQQSSAIELVCSNSPMEYCVNAVTKTFLNGWSILVFNAISRIRLDQFPFLDAIFLSAVWLGLANIVSNADFVDKLTTGVRTSFNGLADNYKSISPTFRANALFVGILIVGAYLSFSSVIAIPTLQDAVLQDANKPEDLKTRLQAVALEKVKFDAYFPDISASPIIPGTIKTQTTDSGLKGPTVPNAAVKTTDQETGVESKAPDENVKEAAPSQASIGVTPYYAFLQKNASRRFAALRSNWNGLRENFRSSQMTVIDLAAETFDLSNRGRKGIRETQQHFLSIDLWYRRWWAERASALSACRAAIEKVGADVSDLVDLIDANLRAQISTTSSRDSDLGEFTKRQSGSEEAAQSLCAISDSADYEIPLREDFGRYLGIFGTATQWLLKTESLSLVLITGLLGFGLLGAACSTFIRNVGNRNRDDPLVVNLAGVILRGASAAIMIFLGVYGGLAVFAGSNVSPNPYVVLFTCFVAAVYSEDAWAWGSREFNSRLANRSGQPAPGVTAPTSVVRTETAPTVSESREAGSMVAASEPPEAGSESAASEPSEAGSRPVAGMEAAERPTDESGKPPRGVP